MSLDQVASPTGLFVMAIVGLAFVRFSVWWMLVRPLLRLLLRPASLLVLAVAVAAAVRLG